MNRPAHRPRLRLLRISALVLGAIMLFWLPIEDPDERLVILFAAAICALAAAYFLVSSMVWQKEPSRMAASALRNGRWLMVPLICTLAGLALTPVTLFLMAFKSGLHGHSSPDFTPGQITAVILRTPIWTGAGLLIGLGITLLKKVKLFE